ncbi:acetyl-CoA acetyltransferase [Desulfitobacterium dichloroeliminans LMG P-21439]|uniref:Acetyl-CoA acetyltransferase n=1 Tax=Desulfitobacterium dichloroeliminans (strain LMG P-21439 / DCA1) TaxID=871963 RepID=L0F4Y9_DESDL|nr:thiolase family protein [Desulfitobacterium dichloroeliminans]AGA68257.1 acetyl-CoA acetyltransferase [Desulfitobacterium dichloroeliminans LMG P-21439]
MREAVIVACGRSPIGKAPRGALKYTRPDDLAAQVLQGTLAKVPELDPALIEDFILGCAFPEAEQGVNVARSVVFRAGLPENVPGQTVNRFCASGLQSVASANATIMSGMAEIVVAGGMESMSMVPMSGNNPAPNPYLMDYLPAAYISMGLTAENVAEKYGISRQEQDEFSLESHKKAAKAQATGKFDEQIISIESVCPTRDEKGRPSSKMVIFDNDEGIRKDTSLEGLAKLKPVFKMGGTVTAGNSSQTSDGAAMVILMSKEKAQSLGIKPIAKLLSFAAEGVDPAYMGIGPIKAIPKALKIADKTLADIELIELNEAFASQSLACIRELSLNPEIINVNGGAIALGHPLGCTGSFLLTKLISEMAVRENKYGLVSMCIGGGMGAAAVIELL